MSFFGIDRNWSSVSDVERTLVQRSLITQNSQGQEPGYIPPVRLSLPQKIEPNAVYGMNVMKVRGRGEMLAQSELEAPMEFKAYCIQEELGKLAKVDYSDSAIENILSKPGQFDDFISGAEDSAISEPSFERLASKKSSISSDLIHSVADEVTDNHNMLDDIDNSSEATVDVSDLSTSVDITTDFDVEPMRRYGFDESMYTKVDLHSVMGCSKTPSPCSSPLPNRTLIEESFNDICLIEEADSQVPENNTNFNSDNETWEYLNTVKNKISSKPHIYNTFMKIMTEWKNDGLNTRTMLSQLSDLFSDHSDLLNGLKRLLPPDVTLPLKNSHVGTNLKKTEVEISSKTPKRCRNALVLALLKKDVNADKKIDADNCPEDMVICCADAIKEWLSQQIVEDDRPVNPHLTIIDDVEIDPGDNPGELSGRAVAPLLSADVGDAASDLVSAAVDSALDELGVEALTIVSTSDTGDVASSTNVDNDADDTSVSLMGCPSETIPSSPDSTYYSCQNTSHHDSSPVVFDEKALVDSNVLQEAHTIVEHANAASGVSSDLSTQAAESLNQNSDVVSNAISPMDVQRVQNNPTLLKPGDFVKDPIHSVAERLLRPEEVQDTGIDVD